MTTPTVKEWQIRVLMVHHHWTPYGQCAGCSEAFTGCLTAQISQIVDAAVEEEREACILAACPWCRDTWPLEDRGGGELHWHDEEHHDCRASTIRARKGANL